MIKLNDKTSSVVRIKLSIYIFLASITTLTFTMILIPISKEYSNKNYCVSKAAKQLRAKLPNTYIEESGLNRTELVNMLAYQLCTHREVNK